MRRSKSLSIILVISFLWQDCAIADPKASALSILRPLAGAQRSAGPVQNKTLLDKKYRFSPDFKNRHNKMISIMEEAARALGRLNVNWVKVKTTNHLSHTHKIPIIEMVDLRLPHGGYRCWSTGYMLSMNELIYNAIDAVAMRWCEEGYPRRYRGVIRVNIRRIGNDLLVEVDDNGIGFNMAELKRVFKAKKIQSKKKIAKYKDLRLIGFAGQGISGMYGRRLIAGLGGRIEIDTFRPDSGAHKLTYRADSNIVIEGSNRTAQGSNIRFIFPEIFNGKITAMLPGGVLPQDTQAVRGAEIAILRPVANAERQVRQWKTSDWGAVAEIFGFKTDDGAFLSDRTVILNKIAAKSSFLYTPDEEGREHVFNFHDAGKIMEPAQLRRLSEQLQEGNEAAYEALYYGFYNYILAWSEAPSVTCIRGRKGIDYLDSEDLCKEAIPLLDRLVLQFDYRKGNFCAYLNSSLYGVRRHAEQKSRNRKTREREAGYANGTEAYPEELEEEEMTIESAIERARCIIRAIFTEIRTKIYRDAYVHARVVMGYSHKDAVKSANYVVQAQGASYADEYILREYLFGGELPQNPKTYNQIGKENGGIPIIKQTGEGGALEEDTGTRKPMGKAAIDIRFNRTKDLLYSYLAAMGIETRAEKQSLKVRIALIKTLIKEGPEILAKLPKNETPAVIDMRKNDQGRNTVFQNILRPLAALDR